MGGANRSRIEETGARLQAAARRLRAPVTANSLCEDARQPALARETARHSVPARHSETTFPPVRLRTCELWRVSERLPTARVRLRGGFSSVRVRDCESARLWGPAKLRDMRDCELLRPLAASPLADREATSPCQTAATRRRRADGDGEPAETETRRMRRADGDGEPAEAETPRRRRCTNRSGGGDPAETETPRRRVFSP